MRELPSDGPARRLGAVLADILSSTGGKQEGRDGGPSLPSYGNRSGGLEHALPHRAQRAGPGLQLVEHRLRLSRVLRARGERGEVLEVREQRERQLLTHVGDLQLRRDG